jgi:hypothetical protein
VFPYRKGALSIGIAGAFEYAFALNSSYQAPGTSQSTNYSTKASDYSVGPVLRYAFGRQGAVGVGVQYGAQNYSVDLPPPTMTNAGVPDVAYRFVRPNLEGRINVIPSLNLVANVGYLFVLDAGEILSDTFFVKSHSSASAFDASIGAIDALGGGFDVRAGFDIRRYAFSFSPQPTDPRIASSASDTYWGIAAGVGYSM